MTISAVGTALGEVLRDGDDVHRCAAARALGRIADPQSVEALKQALIDEDPDLRVDAAAALGGFASRVSAEALMENLIHDPEGDVKLAAIASLIKVGHQPVIPLLKGLAISRTEDIAWDEDEIYSDGWDSWLDMQLAAIHGLGRLGAEDAVPEIVAAMQDEMGQDVSEPAIGALARLGRPGAAALSELFATGDVRLRRRIAAALDDGVDPRFDALRDRCLKDENPQVRLPVAIGLARRAPTDPCIATLFDDPDPGVRAAMVAHAGAAHADRVLDKITDTAAEVQTEAFKVVARRPELFQANGIAKSVRAAIAGDVAVAAQAALAWVALVGPRATASLGAALNKTETPIDFRIGAIDALRKIGPASTPHLLAAAGDENRQLRLAALTALAEFAATDPDWPNPAGDGLLTALNGELVAPPEEAEEEAVPEASEPDDAAQDEAALDEAEVPAPAPTSTLQMIVSGTQDGARSGPDDAVEPAPVALSDQEMRLIALSEQRAMSKKKISLESTVAPYLDIRRFAAQLLGDVAQPDVTARLIEVLGSDDTELRHAALQSLAQHGEKIGAIPADALDALKPCVSEGETATRMLAIRTLARVAGDEADAILGNLLDDDEEHVRLEAVRALGLRGAVDDRVEARLGDANSGVRLAAAAALARCRGAGSVEPLVALAIKDDGTYRREIARLLAKAAPEQATRRFLGMLSREDDRRHWLVAIDALAEMHQEPNRSPELKVA